jgi:hypothetical protein
MVKAPEPISSRLLTSLELATWPFCRASSSFLEVGSSVFCDWS